MDGSFQDEIFGFFTDVWHQRSDEPLRDNAGKIIRIDGKATARTISHKGNPKWKWFWQLQGDSDIDLNTNCELSKQLTRHGISSVPADYAEIERIMKMD